MRRHVLWIGQFRRFLDEAEIFICKYGLDCYLFLRLLHTALKLLFPMALLALPVLLPVNYTSRSQSTSGLDRFSIANVTNGENCRYWITALVATLANVHLCYVLFREFKVIVRIRQAHLHRSSRLQAVTSVLVTELPPDLWNGELLAHLYSRFNEGPTEVILPGEDMHAARKTELELLLKKRDDLARNTAIQRRRLPISHLKSWIQVIVSSAHLRWQVIRVRAEARKLRSVAIIRFSSLFTAHLVLQATTSSEPFKMKAHILSDKAYDGRRHIFKSRLERSIHSISITVILNVLEIVWAVPIAMTGLLSQLSYLDTISIDLADLSEWQVSAIQGLAPQAALSLLMYCFPYIICALSNFFVHFEGSSVETLIQRHYFTFLYVQLFLVVSISSGITTMIPDLVSGFQSIPLILARNLPKSCNYFFSYLILQAVVQTSTILFQLPDGLWRGLRRGQAEHSMKRVRWSLVYPVFANLICICAYIMKDFN